ncbi:MAG: polyprenyl synthetase family protein [Candidatus Ratteibacteria bacterium]|nr:polyprenyl synthetase family protein [Candidatus Ratteibacteria bacterium]
MLKNSRDFKNYIEKKQKKINATLKNLLPPKNKDILSKAIHYSVFSGGKRFRPILCLAAYEMFHSENNNILTIASSIELFHAFTLVHDDLPCMDNDDYRRGKLTSHKVFGEPLALLAGDALFNLGYEVIVNSKIPDKVKIEVIKEISRSLGTEGVVGGQAKDITTKKKNLSIKQLKKIYLGKTASLLEASVKIGGLVAGATARQLNALSCYGKNLGLGFQIMDDVLETIEGSKVAEENYVTLAGLENAKKEAIKTIDKAKNSLNIFGKNAKILKFIANWCLERSN